jgi:hydrogenase maturation factor
VPARVTQVGEELVTVEVRGQTRQVKSMIDVQPGDFVTLGMGLVLEKISEKRFEELSSFNL